MDANSIWLVVADGEGPSGATGAGFDHLTKFYIQELGASDAMAVDGGTSTELVLRTALGVATPVTTATSENHAVDLQPLQEGEVLETGGPAGGQTGGLGAPGVVFSYLSVSD